VGKIKRKIEVLSGGQCQCVAIARTISRDAKLLIMDEPTAALGVEETANIYTLIRKLRADGIPIIIISHNMEEIYGLADRFAVLKNGKLVGIRDKKNTVIDDIIKMIISGKSA
jgi:D-xylose transport system ATP-binding protein